MKKDPKVRYLVLSILFLLLTTSILYDPISILTTAKPLIFLILAYIIIQMLYAALTRVSHSKMGDGIKFCWVLLILFLPVIGSLATLIVVKD